MIRSFKDRETQKVWDGEASRRLPNDIQNVALRKLAALDAAERLDDLRQPPGNRLEALKDDRKGQHSVRINQQWRICFRWTEGGCEDVEICDYHRG
jgi:toxin HigB-1